MPPQSVVFLSDFGPMPALENDSYTSALAELGRSLGKPKSIVIASSHFVSRGPLAVSSAAKPGILHDYSGFPPEFYKLDYPCPGDPALAEDIVRRLSAAGILAQKEPNHPLDHGVWVPLSRAFPKADIPVVALSLPDDDPKKTFEAGRTLAPLAGEGVLLAASGALSHNLRLALSRQKTDPPDPWALEFDAWLTKRIKEGNLEDLFAYKTKAPHARLAAPTADHFDPLFFFLGAASDGTVSAVHESIRYANGLIKLFIARKS